MTGRAVGSDGRAHAVSHFLWLDEGVGRQPFSGVENHLSVLLPALANRGHDVELMVFAPRRGPAIDARLAQLAEADVRIQVLEVPRARRWRYLRRRLPQYIFDLIPAFRHRRDRIIHLHLDFALSPTSARLAGCRRVVMSLHNDEPWFSRPLARRWLRWLDGGIAGYIAISDRVADHYAEVVGIPRERMRRIYYGIDVPAVRHSRDEIRRAHGIPTDRTVVGFVGRLAPQKNLERFLDALALVPGVHAVLVGEGEQGPALRRRAATMSNVQFLGYQPNGAALIGSFDGFCLPSRFEGLGLVLVEAMQQGVPVIGSRAGAIPEVLSGGRYGRLVDPDSTEELADALRELTVAPAELRNRAEDAQEYARARFSVAEMVDRTIEVYAQLA